MHTVRVQVTQEDIDKGVACETRTCPLARAVSRAVGEPWCVGFTSHWALDESKYIMYLVTPVMRDFIIRFDGNEEVKPFEFDIEIE